MWYKAAITHSYEQAKKVWDNIYRGLEGMNTGITTLTLQLGDTQLVVAYAEVEPSRAALNYIESAMKGFRMEVLPPEVQQTLLNRRYKHSIEAEEKYHKGGIFYESHTPTKLDYNKEALLEDSMYTLEKALEADYRGMKRELLQKEKSLFNASKKLRFIDLQAKLILADDEEAMMFQIAYDYLVDRMETATKYLFTASALKMAEAVADDNTTLEHLHSSLWIELEGSQVLETGAEVKAIFVCRMGTPRVEEEEAEEGAYIIEVYDSELGVVTTLMYQKNIEAWAIHPDKGCEYGTCDITTVAALEGTGNYHTLNELGFIMPLGEGKVLVLCEGCKEEIDFSIMFLRTALKMIHLDYALSSSPEPFPIKNMISTERKMVPRHHGKGKPKEKTITTEVPYVYVSYDVSIPPEQRQTEKPSSLEGEDKRINWFSLHGKDEIIYEKRAVPDISRTYRGTRFRSLISIVRTHTQPGGTYTDEETGEEYTLLETEGEYMVVGTVRYPNGRYTPMLRPEHRKKVTVRKISAEMYK